MIKLIYYACIFLVLNACSVLSGDVETFPTYRVMRVQTDSLPSFFHSGTLTIFGKPIPLSSFSITQDYSHSFFTIVGMQESFSIYKGPPEGKLLLENKETTYVLRSICRGQDVKASIPIFFGRLFECHSNIPLCLRVIFSPLYRENITREELEKLLLETPPLTIKFEEIRPS